MVKDIVQLLTGENSRECFVPGSGPEYFVRLQLNSRYTVVNPYLVKVV